MEDDDATLSPVARPSDGDVEQTLRPHDLSEFIGQARVREQLRRSGVWYAPQLEESLREESPTAYKPIEEGMRAQSELTRIVRRLRPVLVHKGM